MKKSLGPLALLALVTTNAFALTNGTATLLSHKETSTLSGKAIFKDVPMPVMLKTKLQIQQSHRTKSDEPMVRLNAALYPSDNSSGQFDGSRNFAIYMPTAGDYHSFDSTSELCLYKVTDDHMAYAVGCTSSDDMYAVTGDYTYGYTAIKLNYTFKESGRYLVLMDVSLKMDNDSTRYYTDSADVFDVTVDGGKVKIVKAA